MSVNIWLGFFCAYIALYAIPGVLYGVAKPLYDRYLKGTHDSSEGLIASFFLISLLLALISAVPAYILGSRGWDGAWNLDFGLQSIKDATISALAGNAYVWGDAIGYSVALGFFGGLVGFLFGTFIICAPSPPSETASTTRLPSPPTMSPCSSCS